MPRIPLGCQGEETKPIWRNVPLIQETQAPTDLTSIENELINLNHKTHVETIHHEQESAGTATRKNLR